VNTHRPALSFKDFLETLDRLVRAKKITGTGNLRSGIYLSLAAIERGTAVQVKPPQVLLRAVALMGRVLGYRLD
jgi:hypothetical protein